MTVEWTPDRIKLLMALWTEGLTTAEIGRRLGVTKNAVVGKAFRLRMPRRTAPVQAAAPCEAEVIRLESLRGDMCSWPVGEPGTDEFRFCGRRPTVHGKPYCAEHCARAYVKGSKDRKETEAA